METKYDNLFVAIDGKLLTAHLVSKAYPHTEDDEVRYKHHYEISNGRTIAWGWTKCKARAYLIDVADDFGWRVLQPLN